MRVLRLEINRFRKFKHEVFEFKPGLIVVEGPNEAGKSTLHQALRAALYADPGSRAKEVREIQTWGEDELPCLTLEMEADSERISIIKDMSAKKATLQVGTRKITSRKKIEEEIAQLSGFSDEKMFLATACVNQDEMADLGKAGAGLMEKLGEKLTGAGGRSVDEVVAELERECGELLKGKRGAAYKYAGRIKDLEDEREILARRLEQARTEARQAEQDETELEEIRKELSGLEKKISLNREVVDKNKELMGLEKELWQRKEKFERLCKAEESADKRKKLTHSLDGYKGYEALSEAAHRLEKLEPEAKPLRDELQRIKSMSKSWVRNLVLRLITGFTGLGLGLVGYFAEWNLWPWILLGAATLLIGSGAWTFLRWRKALRKINEFSDKLQRIETEEKELLSGFGREKPDEALRAYREYQVISEELVRLQERIQDLSGIKDSEGLKRLLRMESADIRTLEDRIREHEQYRLSDPEELVQRERALADDENTRGALARKRMALEVSREEMQTDPENVFSLEEELSEVEQNLEFWNRRARVLKLASEGLVEARARVLASAGVVLEEKVGPLISRITSGRYSRVKISEEKNKFELKVFSEEKDDWVSDQELSLATREQVYLAGRLALVDLITGGRKPVIILDDPFAHFDDDRLNASLGLLKELSREFQMILFSPTNRYSDAADLILRLGV